MMANVHGFFGDILRGIGAGYAEASHQEAVQSDRASITPFEAVTTATGALKQATRNVPVVNKVTGVIHAGAGFGMLIAGGTVNGALAAPGAAANNVLSGVADAIDGRGHAAPAGANHVANALDGLGLQ